MLIGADFVIASPTKTGTKSLNHLARSNPELGLRYAAPGHRMTVPDGCEGYTRHMVVRDPYARLVSIYRYLRRRVGDWGHRAAAELGFAQWVEHFLDLRRGFDPRSYNAEAPSIWLATQAECWRILGGDRFWKLEAIDRLLTALNIGATLEVLNASGGNVSIPSGCLERVWNEWSREDCELFGYGRI